MTHTAADNFRTWFEGVTAEAAATAVGRSMADAGFGVQHTGGGCLAWERTAADGRYVYVTDDDAGLGTNGAGSEWYVGRYNADGEDEDQDGPFATLAEAIEAADKLLPVKLVDAESKNEAVTELLAAAKQGLAALRSAAGPEERISADRALRAAIAKAEW